MGPAYSEWDCPMSDLSKGMGHEAEIVHVNRAARTEGGGRRRTWGEGGS